MGTAREWECVILRLNGLSRTKYRYYVMRVENYFCSIYIGALCGNLLRVFVLSAWRHYFAPFVSRLNLGLGLRHFLNEFAVRHNYTCNALWPTCISCTLSVVY